MDRVPEEVLKYLSTFLDNNTRLKMRAVNNMWFKCIDLVDFKFYFTKEADLPNIVDRLLQYKTPISASFLKCPIKNYDPFLAQISRLTGLTGLELPNNFLTYPGSSLTNGKKMMVLSTLTNLKSLTRDRSLLNVTVKSDYFLASQMYKNFKNLTSLEVLPVEERRAFAYDTIENVENVIKQNTEIRKAAIYLKEKTAIDQRFVDAFSGHKHLTELYIRIYSARLLPCNLYNTFSGLKSLSFIGTRLQGDESEHVDIALFGQLTNLERLVYHGPSPLVNIDKLEKLTSLELQNLLPASGSEWHKIYQSIPALKHLKNLSISIHEHSEDEYQFLAHLPSLEQLRIQRDEKQPKGVKILGHLTNNPNLTKFILQSTHKPDLHELERVSGTLLNLEVSKLQERELTEEDLAGLASLTTLTRLVILDGPYGAAMIRIVEKFSALKELIFDSRATERLSLQNLTNLECLATKLHVASLEELAKCTHMTYLRADMDIENDTDCGVLAHLPLKVLIMDQPQPYDSWWHTVGKLTSLESLVAYGVIDKNMHDWDGLTNLTRLAMFEQFIQNGDHFHKLKSLQRVGGNRHLQDHYLTDLPYLFEVVNGLNYFRDLQQKL